MFLRLQTLLREKGTVFFALFLLVNNPLRAETDERTSLEKEAGNGTHITFPPFPCVFLSLYLYEKSCIYLLEKRGFWAKDERQETTFDLSPSPSSISRIFVRLISRGQKTSESILSSDEDEDDMRIANVLPRILFLSFFGCCCVNDLDHHLHSARLSLFFSQAEMMGLSSLLLFVPDALGDAFLLSSV